MGQKAKEVEDTGFKLWYTGTMTIKNGLAKTLIFGSFSFITFLLKKFPAPFRFFDLAFYCLFSFFDLVFYRPLFFSSFSLLFCPCVLAHVVSSLTNPNLLGTKTLDCCM
jgi:hypothetical protein